MATAPRQAALQALQKRLAHAFATPALLELALTHRSHSADHNERLEFLGDSVLNLSISHLLFERLDRLPEGDLSRVRANLVRQESLHRIALTLELSGLLHLGEGEARSGGPQRPSILADALEAVLGAVYLDAGFLAAESLVRRLFAGVVITPGMAAAGRDPKTELQEWLQGHKMKLPVYKVAGTVGAAHRQTFQVDCEVPAMGLTQRGLGASRRAGEQAAAAAMLIELKQSGIAAGK